MISIIIPVYNGERYIPELIKNFKAQQASREALELVFVDDGSTDGSLELLNTYADSREFSLSVYSQPNSGVSTARNLGLEKAKGDFITFADVDDFVTEDYFKLLDGTARKSEFDAFVFSNIRVRGSELPHVSAGYSAPSKISNTDMLLKLLSNPTRYGVYNVLYKRKFLLRNFLKFAVGFKYYEDYDFLYRTFALAKGILITQKPIYLYMLREGSAMQRFTRDRIICIKLIEELGNWLETAAPDFYPTFAKWGVSRIYWSVLWQAALAFGYRDFKKFEAVIGAGDKLSGLYDYPDKRIRLSSWLFEIGKPLYYLAVNLLVASHSRVEKADIKSFEDLLKKS